MILLNAWVDLRVLLMLKVLNNSEDQIEISDLRRLNTNVIKTSYCECLNIVYWFKECNPKSKSFLNCWADIFIWWWLKKRHYFHIYFSWKNMSPDLQLLLLAVADALWVDCSVHKQHKQHWIYIKAWINCRCTRQYFRETQSPNIFFQTTVFYFT